jgi:hypothetical protein
MKTAMLLAVSLAGASMALPAVAKDYIEGSYMYNALVQVCTDTAEDDRLGLHRTLKDNRISKQAAVEGVVCNGKILMDFARYHQSVKVISMLKPYEDRIKGKVTIQDVASSSPN